jgi:hypothetical protein
MWISLPTYLPTDINLKPTPTYLSKTYVPIYVTYAKLFILT